MITGHELENLAVKMSRVDDIAESRIVYDWQAIANELNQRQDNEIQSLGEEIRDAITPKERIATSSSTTFPNQRTCETCALKIRCTRKIRLYIGDNPEDTGWLESINLCSLYAKEG